MLNLTSIRSPKMSYAKTLDYSQLLLAAIAKRQFCTSFSLRLTLILLESSAAS